MSMHFDQTTTQIPTGHVYLPCGDSTPVTLPYSVARRDPVPQEPQALVTPEDDEGEDGEWEDGIVPGAETNWEWIDDADLFDDLFDDTEPLEGVDWASRDREEEDEDL